MTSEEKALILKSTQTFKDLSSNQLKIIADVLTERTFTTGEVLIEQGAIANCAYIITEGSVKVYRTSEEGDEISLSVKGPKEIIGEMAFLDGEVRSASVEAIQEVKVLTLKYTDLREILLKYPETAINLLKTLSQRVRKIDENIEDIYSKKLSQRTLKVLDALASYFPDKTITLSHEEIAQIVGATRARVTEALDELEKQGKVTLSHRQIQLH